MVGATRLERALLWIFLLTETPLQAWLCYRWTEKHGFWGGILHWLEGVARDPVEAAAVIDFVLFIAWVGIWLLKDYPRERSKKSPGFFAWCALYLVWPSLGLMIYFLFIKKADSRRSAA